VCRQKNKPKPQHRSGLVFRRRAIGYIFCSAAATQKDTASIPHTKSRKTEKYLTIEIIQKINDK
jgi:hypothetical protein